MSDKRETVWLKLGGSLITDKRVPETVRHEVLQRLAAEIAAARAANPAMRLLIGHGSGSFGHVSARRYGTREQVRSAEDWYGYAVTGDAAARLNRHVTAALLAAGIPAWSIQPGASVRCDDGRIVDGPLQTVIDALDRGVVPLLYGDVVLDSVRGGTIASTEEIFAWLAQRIAPRRIVLAGEVDGIYTADPLIDAAAQRIPAITPDESHRYESALGASFGVDVTGGMRAKVLESLALVQAHAALDILICGGMEPDAVRRALLDESPMPGTRIHAA